MTYENPLLLRNPVSFLAVQRPRIDLKLKGHASLFMRLFPIKNKYLYRHKMLEYLYNKIKNEPLHRVDLKKSKSSFKEMADSLNIEPILLREYHQAFHGFEEKEDHVKCFVENGEYVIGIDEPGIRAYLDDFWISEGEKDLNERIYNKTKWIVPVFALIITIISLSISITTIRQTQRKGEQLDKELSKYKHETQQTIDSIKKSLSLIPDSLKNK